MNNYERPRYVGLRKIDYANRGFIDPVHVSFMGTPSGESLSYVYNSTFDRYDPVKETGYFFAEKISGFGLSYDTKYINNQNGSDVTQLINQKQRTFEMTLNIFGDSYAEYQKLISFFDECSTYPSQMALEYKPAGVNQKVYFCVVDLASISKGELNNLGVLECKLKLNSRSLWYEKRQEKTQSVPEDISTRYDFTYDDVYSSDKFATSFFENSGDVAASLWLKIEDKLDGGTPKKITIDLVDIDSNETVNRTVLDDIQLGPLKTLFISSRPEAVFYDLVTYDANNTSIIKTREDVIDNLDLVNSFGLMPTLPPKTKARLNVFSESKGSKRTVDFVAYTYAYKRSV